VGAVTHVTLHDLVLAPDVPYFAFVRAVGPDGQRSFERMSEGFRSGAGEDPTLGLDHPPGAGCGCRAGGDRGGGPAVAGLLFLAGAIVLGVRRRR
jgi:MYXO-CTERM domain-containing protein